MQTGDSLAEMSPATKIHYEDFRVGLFTVLSLVPTQSKSFEWQCHFPTYFVGSPKVALPPEERIGNRKGGMKGAEEREI